MSLYRVRVEETYTYFAEYEAESEAEAVSLAESELVESDGPESAFGSYEFGETLVREAEAVKRWAETYPQDARALGIVDASIARGEPPF